MSTIQNHMAARPSPTAQSGHDPKRSHRTHRVVYAGVVAGYHAWDCSCGDRIFTEHGPSVPPPWQGRTSSSLRQLT